MGFVTGPVFTAAGRALQARAIAGDDLNFTKMQLGDGQLGSQSIENLTALINSVATVGIIGMSRSGNYAKITSLFSNAELSTGFYWREIGLFAADPDHPNDRAYDILYCYQNAGASADYIPAGGSGLITKRVNVVAIVSNATSVTATITPVTEAEDILFTPAGGISATNVQDALEELDSDKYSVPSGGIPKTDMTSDVQGSLASADSAYQLPASGIPKAHLNSAVQTSLGKADSAYQWPENGIPMMDLSSGVTKYFDSASNENLIANPFFAVNQFGETSYGDSDSRCVDLWKKINGNVSDCSLTGEAGINFKTKENTADFKRIQQKLICGRNGFQEGETYTLSMVACVNSVLGTVSFGLADGNASRYSKVISTASGEWELLTYTFTLGAYIAAPTVRIIASNSRSASIDIDINAIKLERGSVSTLLNDVLNYDHDLEECRRYFFPLVNGGTAAETVALAMSQSGTIANAIIDSPLLYPSDAGLLLKGQASDFGLTKSTTAAAVACTNVALFRMNTGKAVKLMLTVGSGSGFSVGDVAAVSLASGGGAYIYDNNAKWW